MYVIPSLGDLMGRARNAFRANLKGSDAWVWPNNVYVSAKVLAGSIFEVFGFASYISRQKFAHTAPDIESLLLHGEEFGIARKAAAPAVGKVRITASAALSANAAAVFQRADGLQYLATSGGAINSAGDLVLPVMAAADGKASNSIDGTPMEIVSGVTTAGTASASADGDIALGVDVEGIEAYRARILFRKRNPPHGGSAADYVIWASEVAGVTRVFVEPLWAGPGTVRVFVLMDTLYADGIPSEADLVRVREYIDAVKPAGAKVTVVAPITVPVNIVVTGLQPNTTDVREAALQEIHETFLLRSRAAGGAAPHPGMPFLATPASFSRSWIWQAVANSTGEDRHVIAQPAVDVALASGEIAVVGSVTFAG